MRIVLVIMSAWAGLAAVCGGLFLALVRGGGGTDLAPLPAGPSSAADVAVPAQRAPAETRQPTPRGAPARRRARG